MPPDTVIPQLATVFGSISGINRTFNQLPASLNAGDLPALMFSPGRAELSVAAAGGLTEEVRDYALILYVKPLANDKFGAAHNDARPFFGKIRTAWAQAIALNGLANVDQADLIEDSGVVTLAYGQSLYIGIEWTLRVYETFTETVEA